MTKELSMIRYNYHLQSVKDFLNDIIAERNRIIVKQKIHGADHAKSVITRSRSPSNRRGTVITSKSIPSFAPVSPKSEVCLTDSDLRQISLMKRNNEAFAKKLLLEAER